MTRTDLVKEMADKTNLSKKDCAIAVDAFIGAVTEALKAGDKVQLVGFGTFDVTERAARTGRNPRTGEPMKIAAKKNGKFKPGTALKNL